MKPLEALAGLPRSADIARVVAAQGRHGEVQAESLATSFMREMTERSQAVNEAPKSDNSVDSESAGGSAAWESPGGKGNGNDGSRKEASGHPIKGKLLDIQGA
jgi:hypothetical protein